jgi:hypothetical protein
VSGLELQALLNMCLVIKTCDVDQSPDCCCKLFLTMPSNKIGIRDPVNICFRPRVAQAAQSEQFVPI